MNIDVNWVGTVYNNGRGWHVGNIVQWRGVYYICCVDGIGHGTEDSQIRVCASTDLENWTSQIAIGRKTIDPNLLPIGDKLLLYRVREGTGDSEFGFPSQQVVTWTTDGTTWASPKRYFLRDHDFWHRTARISVKCPSILRVTVQHQHVRPSAPMYYRLPSRSTFPTCSPATTPDLCR